MCGWPQGKIYHWFDSIYHLENVGKEKENIKLKFIIIIIVILLLILDACVYSSRSRILSGGGQKIQVNNLLGNWHKWP